MKAPPETSSPAQSPVQVPSSWIILKSPSLQVPHKESLKTKCEARLVMGNTWAGDGAHIRNPTRILKSTRGGRSPRKEAFMRPYRDIATLAAAQIGCFVLLTHLEPNFFLIHLYESILYIAILVMLFYMEDRWAYMIGMLASVVWLGLAYETGILGSGVRQLFEFRTSGMTANLVGMA